MSRLQKALFLSDKGYADLKKSNLCLHIDELGYASAVLCNCYDLQ